MTGPNRCDYAQYDIGIGAEGIRIPFFHLVRLLTSQLNSVGVTLRHPHTHFVNTITILVGWLLLTNGNSNIDVEIVPPICAGGGFVNGGMDT